MPHLTLEQRYEISASKNLGLTQKQIAQKLGCSPSTISRELQRNKGAKDAYNVPEAHKKAISRVKRKAWKFTYDMKTHIVTKLKEYYSPEQIRGRAILEGIPMVSIETIYQWIYAQKRKGMNLTHFLRCPLPDRRKRSNNNKKGDRYQTKDQLRNVPK